MTPPAVSPSLAELVAQRESSDLTFLHVVPSLDQVRDLVVVSDIDGIASVGPDTIILLTPEVAHGGWTISTALRYAWERRACALVVPAQASTSGAVELARRLGISLLSTSSEIVPLALELAEQIGLSRAGAITRIQAFVDRVSRQPRLEDVLRLTSDELAGAAVRVETESGLHTASPHADAPGVEHRPAPGAGSHRVRVAVDASGSSGDLLTATVHHSQVDAAAQLLRAIAPTVKALLAESRLAAIRASLPLLSATALTGAAPMATIDGPEVVAVENPAWPIQGEYRGVCVLSDDASRLSSAVHEAWLSEFGEIPLTRFTEGWFAFVPASADALDGAETMHALSGFAPLHLLGVRVGASRRHEGAAEAAASVHEAWLTARVASATRPFLEFDAIDDELVPRLLPPSLAEQLLGLAYPRFVAEPDAAQLTASVTAYLAHQGSVSRAAAALGLHRNTLQQRLRRAQVLGLPLSDPRRVLSIHLLLAASTR